VTLDHLSRQEIDGAYRRLCAALIGQAAFVLADRGLRRNEKKSALLYRQELRRQRDAARSWMYGGDAVIPFSEACEHLGLEEGGVQDALERFANDPDMTLARRWRNPAAAGRKAAIKAGKPGSAA
jgi:hypothetical protein